MTDLDLARLELMQADRRVRRITEDRKHQRSMRLDRLYYDAWDRRARARARLDELERATQPAAGLEPAASNDTD